MRSLDLMSIVRRSFITLGLVGVLPLNGCVVYNGVGGDAYSNDNAPIEPESTGLDLDNRVDCENADGVWKRWGLSQEETCNLRANDYGKECTDKGDCEGWCITECVDEECDTGTCSEFVNFYGCTRFWRNGIQNDYVSCID